MIVIGLTGSIGMGKSTVAEQLARLGAKVCNADAIVHALMAKDGLAVGPISQHFPGVVRGGAVDRQALGKIVFADKVKLSQLERILHPLVIAEENSFIKRAMQLGAKMVVLDIPLLFETGSQERCDLTLVASAPAFLQRQRVLARPGMTAGKLASILKAQLPDREKRRRGNYVVLTGLGKRHSYKTVVSLVQSII